MDTKIVVGLCVAIVVTAVSIAGIALSVTIRGNDVGVCSFVNMEAAVQMLSIELLLFFYFSNLILIPHKCIYIDRRGIL